MPWQRDKFGDTSLTVTIISPKKNSKKSLKLKGKVQKIKKAFQGQETTPKKSRKKTTNKLCVFQKKKNIKELTYIYRNKMDKHSDEFKDYFNTNEEINEVTMNTKSVKITLTKVDRALSNTL